MFFIVTEETDKLVLSNSPGVSPHWIYSIIIKEKVNSCPGGLFTNSQQFLNIPLDTCQFFGGKFIWAKGGKIQFCERALIGPSRLMSTYG